MPPRSGFPLARADHNDYEAQSSGVCAGLPFANASQGRFETQKAPARGWRIPRAHAGQKRPDAQTRAACVGTTPSDPSYTRG